MFTNYVTHIYLGLNKLTDATGSKIAQYLSNTTICTLLDLRVNFFSALTYQDIASSLYVNSSLQILRLCGNNKIKYQRFDVQFIQALRFNPHRPDKTEWRLYTRTDEFERLRAIAVKSTSPSMLEFLLCLN